MKKIFILYVVTLSLTVVSPDSLKAQSVAINTDGSTADASAILDIKSTTKGLLIPRLTTSQRTGISPVKGLLVFDSDINSFWFYNGTVWIEIGAASNVWNLTGNAATNPSNNFIGTTDNQPLRLRLNNQWAGELNRITGNYFIGDSAGYHSSGGLNTGFGEKTLFSNTTGAYNTACGGYALYKNTTGYYNTAYGSFALNKNTSGLFNTAIGFKALETNSTGVLNTAVGINALDSNTTGNYNTAVGSGSQEYNTTGFANTSLGEEALRLNLTGDNNTAIGVGALKMNTTGQYNASTGSGALILNTTGNENTANGFEALASNDDGSYNTAVGSRALFRNGSGTLNTAVGERALYNNTKGILNTAIGNAALLFNTVGEQNTAIGANSLDRNSIGTSNTATGQFALAYNTEGNQNTACGVYALQYNATGNNNIAIGYNSGTFSGGFNNTISIGNDGWLNAFDNQVFLGNASTGWIGGWVGWSIYSDGRMKNKITEEVKGLEFIKRLRPVTYYRSIKTATSLTSNKETKDFPQKYDVEKIKFSGFLAQEVEKAAEESSYDFDGVHKPKNEHDLYSLSYESFVVPLVKAVQEQQSIIESLQKQAEAAKAEIPMQIGKQQGIIEKQQKQIDDLLKELQLIKEKIK